MDSTKTHVLAAHKLPSDMRMNFNKQLVTMWQNQQLCDISLLSHEGHIFKAHACIVAANSSIFRSKLLHNQPSFIETVGSGIYKLTGISSETIEVALRFMYGFEPQTQNEVNILKKAVQLLGIDVVSYSDKINLTTKANDHENVLNFFCELGNASSMLSVFGDFITNDILPDNLEKNFTSKRSDTPNSTGFMDLLLNENVPGSDSQCTPPPDCVYTNIDCTKCHGQSQIYSGMVNHKPTFIASPGDASFDQSIGVNNSNLVFQPFDNQLNTSVMEVNPQNVVDQNILFDKSGGFPHNIFTILSQDLEINPYVIERDQIEEIASANILDETQMIPDGNKMKLELMKETMDGQHIKLCEVCGQTFNKTNALNLHQLKVHANGNLFTCTSCSFKTPRIKDFYGHLLAQHGKIPAGRTVYECSICLYKCLDKSRYLEHRAGHSDEKTFQCGHCGKYYATKRGLRNHMQYHSERSHQCKICSATFKVRSKLNDHIKLVHTNQGEKPFKCGYCPFQAAVRGNVNQHIRNVHKGKPINVIDTKADQRRKVKSYNYAHFEGESIRCIDDNQLHQLSNTTGNVSNLLL